LNMSIARKLKNVTENRTSAAFGLALFFLSAMCASSSTAMEFPEKRQDWLVLKQHGLGSDEVITVLKSLPSQDVRANYSQLLSIAWGFESLPNGLPTDPEIARGRILYAAFDKILGQDGIYAMSRTGNGGRTIYYYVRNFSNHSSALKEYLDSLPPISIKISLHDEPKWNSVFDVLKNVERTK